MADWLAGWAGPSRASFACRLGLGLGLEVCWARLAGWAGWLAGLVASFACRLAGWLVVGSFAHISFVCRLAGSLGMASWLVRSHNCIRLGWLALCVSRLIACRLAASRGALALLLLQRLLPMWKSKTIEAASANISANKRMT